jgi:hypothetical protein
VDLPLKRVECDFFGRLVDAQPNDEGGYSGNVEGEVFRQLLSEDEAGEPVLLFEFQALVGGPGHFTTDMHGNVELRIAGEQPPEALPFWLELEALSGAESSPDHYAGSWTCASLSMLLGDIGPEVPGTWTLEPED